MSPFSPRKESVRRRELAGLAVWLLFLAVVGTLCFLAVSSIEKEMAMLANNRRQLHARQADFARLEKVLEMAIETRGTVPFEFPEPRPRLREVGQREYDREHLRQIERKIEEDGTVALVSLQWMTSSLRLRTAALEDIERVLDDPAIPDQAKVNATLFFVRRVLDLAPDPSDTNEDPREYR